MKGPNVRQYSNFVMHLSQCDCDIVLISNQTGNKFYIVHIYHNFNERRTSISLKIHVIHMF